MGKKDLKLDRDLTAQAPEVEIFIPPGLENTVCEFLAHIEAVEESPENRPILIFGPTGVGKSTFIDIFIRYQQKKRGHQIPHPTLNCSQFGGDPNMVRSELFGYDKGSHYRAEKEKQGYIEQANNGVLVLDEIGEMPEETQAKLLIFIQTRKFHRLGGTTELESNAKIIAATNQPKKRFREDFLFRFSHFEIPPLFTRRTDVICFLALKSPDLAASLRPWEILSLLAYNWPGSVREIEECIFQIKRDRLLYEKLGFTLRELRNVPFLDGIRIPFQGTDILFDELKQRRIDTTKIERLLNKFYLGIDPSNKTKPLKKVIRNIINKNEEDAAPKVNEGAIISYINEAKDKPDEPLDALDDYFIRKRNIAKGNGKKQQDENEIQDIRLQYEKWFKEYGLSIFPNCLFDKLDTGLDVFCSLFLQDRNENCDLLKIEKPTLPGSIEGEHKIRIEAKTDLPSFIVPDFIDVDRITKIAYFKVLRSTLGFLFNTEFDEEIFPKDSEALTLLIKSQNPSNAESGGDPIQRLVMLTEKELLKQYYSALLEKNNGNMAAVARVAGVDRSNLYKILKTLDIGLDRFRRKS